MREGWDGIVGSIQSPDVTLALGWASFVLPNNDTEVPEPERQALAALLDELAKELEGASLPQATREYLRRQVQAMQTALRLYAVQGFAAMRDASGQCVAAAYSAMPAIKAEIETQPPARTIVDKCNGIITRVMEACAGAEKLHRGGSAMIDMADAIRKVTGLLS